MKKAFEQRNGKLFEDGDFVAYANSWAAEEARAQEIAFNASIPDLLLEELEQASPDKREILSRFVTEERTDIRSAWASDPRIQPVLLAAAAKASDDDFMWLASALGIVGGHGAIELLTKRLNRLHENRATWEPALVWNLLAQAMGATAGSLLKLNPDHNVAADRLIDLFGHPSNREISISEAAKAYRHDISTRAMRSLQLALMAILTDPDDVLVFHGAEALLDLDASTALARLERLLHACCEDTAFHRNRRGFIINKLLRHSGAASTRAVAVVAKWIPKEASVGRALKWALSLGALVRAIDQSEIENLVQRGLASESPTLRLRAAQLASWLKQDLRATILDKALTDEPDEAVRSALREQPSREPMPT